MNNFGLPADASYSQGGAVVFTKSQATPTQQALLEQMVLLKQQIESLHVELSNMKTTLSKDSMTVKAAPELETDLWADS